MRFIAGIYAVTEMLAAEIYDGIKSRFFSTGPHPADPTAYTIVHWHDGTDN